MWDYKKYRKENREKIYVQDKEYYNKNREHILTHQKEYRSSSDFKKKSKIREDIRSRKRVILRILKD